MSKNVKNSFGVKFINLKSKVEIPTNPFIATFVNRTNKFGQKESYLQVTDTVNPNILSEQKLEKIAANQNKLFETLGDIQGSVNEQIDLNVQFKGQYEMKDALYYKVFVDMNKFKEFDNIQDNSKILIQCYVDYYVYQYRNNEPMIKLRLCDINKVKVLNVSDNSKEKCYTYDESDM